GREAHAGEIDVPIGSDGAEVRVHGRGISSSIAGCDAWQHCFLPSRATIETHAHKVGLQVVPYPRDHEMLRVDRVHSYARFKFIIEVHVAARSEASVAA